SDAQKRADVMHEWHRSLLHNVVPSLINKWEMQLDVKVARYFLQRMKTKWGSCNHKAAHIRLNTELVKKPKDLLEYVVFHEMVHRRALKSLASRIATRSKTWWRRGATLKGWFCRARFAGILKTAFCSITTRPLFLNSEISSIRFTLSGVVVRKNHFPDWQRPK